MAIKDIGYFDDDQIKSQLEAGLTALELNLSATVIDQLVWFTGELHRWNQTYNLTAVRDPLEMVSRHLLDSLSALPFVVGEWVLDVGCGAGLPGIPLALVSTDRQFCLLDSNGKKQRFVEHVCRELALSNVQPVHERVERFNSTHQFDTIICRALAALPEFVSNSGRLLKPGGQLVALKGKLPDEEIAALPGNWQVTEVTGVTIPSLAGERHIVVIRPVKNEPE